MQATDVKPTRLGAAQAAVRPFLERVPKRVKVGLIAFSGEPQIAAPPTTDRELVRRSLDELDFFQATAAPRSATRSPPRRSSG